MQYTNLEQAIYAGKRDTVKQIIEKGVTEQEKNEALVDAAIKGHTDMIKYLVKQGADVHYRNDAALIYTAEEGNIEAVKFLLEKGADANARGGEALYNVIAYSHNSKPKSRMKIAKMLIERGVKLSRETATELLRQVQPAGLIEILESFGGDIHQYYETPLRLAIYDEDVETFEYLLDKGTDINNLDYYVDPDYIWFDGLDREFDWIEEPEDFLKHLEKVLLKTKDKYLLICLSAEDAGIRKVAKKAAAKRGDIKKE
jgi:hypothetical protein